MNGALGLLTRGALAGAAGTTALNAVTYTDMALRARPPSSTQEDGVRALAAKAGLSIPGDDEKQKNRLAGLGPLAGITMGVGIGIGVAAVIGALDTAGARPPWWAQAPMAGALAMAATNIPMTIFGITDPRTWSAEDWLSDVIPHLAYGLAAAAVLADQGASTNPRIDIAAD